MSLYNRSSALQKNAPECVACDMVDMKTRMLLGIRTVDSHPQEALDLVTAATGALFQDNNVATIEEMFERARGVQNDSHHYFQEIIVLSDNLIHAFQRCERTEDMVLVTARRMSANLGMAIAKSRQTLLKVEAAV